MAMAKKNTHRYSMEGLVYTPVELGTIRLGRMESVDDGPDRPVMTDHFRVTTLVKRDGDWIDHRLQGDLLKRQQPDPAGDEGESSANRKLRAIPIHVQFNSPDLVIRSNLQAFDLKSKRLVCASSGGGVAKRAEADGSVEEVECVGNEACEFAAREGVRCKFFGRLHVQIDGQEHPENGFILRTSSFNSLTNIEAQLARYHAAFGGRLAGVPFVLRLRSRSTSKSFWRPIYFVDVELNGVTMAEAVKLARKHEQEQDDAGLDIAALEAVARQGLANGRLFDSRLEDELCEEFYATPPAPDEQALADTTDEATATARRSTGLVLEGFRLPTKEPAAAAVQPGATASSAGAPPAQTPIASPTRPAAAAAPAPAPSSAGAAPRRPSMGRGIVDF